MEVRDKKTIDVSLIDIKLLHSFLNSFLNKSDKCFIIDYFNDSISKNKESIARKDRIIRRLRKHKDTLLVFLN